MIVIVSGTNRKNANSKRIATYYAQLLVDSGEEMKEIDLALLPSDFLTSALYENQGKHMEFNEIIDTMRAADKYVFIVPEYNGSFPGVLKMFLDALPFPSVLEDKKCAIVGLSSGIHGAMLAMSHLTDIFNYLGMHVLADKPHLKQIDSKIANGVLTDSAYQERLKKQSEALIAF